MNEESLYRERVETASLLQEVTEKIRKRVEHLRRLKEQECEPRIVLLLNADIEELNKLLQQTVAYFSSLTHELAPRKEELN